MYSLYMLQDCWKLPDSVLHVHTSPFFFLKGFRLLSGKEAFLESHMLYFCPSEMPSLLEGDLFNCAFFYLYKPTCSPVSNYCWLESETEPSFTEVFNHIHMVMDYGTDFELKLKDCISSRYALQDILNLLCEYMQNPGYVVDRAYKALAIPMDLELPLISIQWKRVVEHGYLPFDVVSSIIQNSEWQEIHRATHPIRVQTREFMVPFATVNLRLNKEIQWQLFFCELKKIITPGDLDILQIAVPYLLSILKNNDSYLSLKKGYHELFFSEVLSGQLQNSAIIKEQLLPLKWEPEDFYCIAELNPRKDPEYYNVISAWINQKNDRRAVNFNGRILIVFHMKDYDQYSRILSSLEVFLRSIHCIGGISDLFQGFGRSCLFQEQASEAFQMACAQQNSSGEAEHCVLYPYHNCAIPHFLSSLSEQQKANLFLDIIRYLQTYDQENRTSYTETLYYYLRNERNLVRTSQEMHIHRNTLVYRIEKIQQLMPYNLNDPDIRFRLRITSEAVMHNIDPF